MRSKHYAACESLSNPPDRDECVPQPLERRLSKYGGDCILSTLTVPLTLPTAVNLVLVGQSAIQGTWVQTLEDKDILTLTAYDFSAIEMYVLTLVGVLTKICVS